MYNHLSECCSTNWLGPFAVANNKARCTEWRTAEEDCAYGNFYATETIQELTEPTPEPKEGAQARFVAKHIVDARSRRFPKRSATGRWLY